MNIIADGAEEFLYNFVDSILGGSSGMGGIQPGPLWPDMQQQQQRRHVEPQLPDLYGDLEVSPAASQETIEAAYKSLCKRFHPDVNRSKEAEERIKKITAAYRVLGKAETRRQYDIARQFGRARRNG